MKLKKLALFLAVSMLSVSIIGCGTQSKEESKETEKETKKETTAKADVEDVTERTVYVSADWVNAAINGEVEGYEDMVVINVAYPATTKDFADYGKGHIPGSLYASIMEVEDATGSEEGAYNLLDAKTVEENLLKLGVTQDTKVLLYGPDVSGTARQAYGYLWCGVKDVKVLNGGLAAWEKAGYETETKENTATAAKEFGAETPVHPEYVTTIEQAKDKLENDDNFRLVSIRSEDEWLGKTSGYSYMDVAGEPEGAVWGMGANSSADVDGLCNIDGDVKTVKTLDELKEYWKDCKFTLDNELAFYCGTGWRACPAFLRVYESGDDKVSVFDGGWYQWIMDGKNPVQIGDPDSDDCIHTTVDKLEKGKAVKE